MIRSFSLLLAVLFSVPVLAQPTGKYWVFLTDKKGTDFNPYTYFEPAAIAHKKQLGLPLSHETDFPVQQKYVAQVAHLSDSVTFASRWFNALVCYGSESQLAQISKLPFVKSIEAFPTEHMELAYNADFDLDLNAEQEEVLKGQLASMQGADFAAKQLNGKGVRVAIFDAGFSSVDKNPAFEHIRQRGGILKTWDFVKKREHVYDHSSHGTNVFACIAGIMSGKQIGLATGADFLLARTEKAHSEPFSEEENWLAAMEWAHQQGAQIINSSLGYTNDRYFRRQMDGKTSLVSRAANMAARKGMLVVNAAGNEGSGKWKKIGAPADADSVLTIGGVEPESEIHTSFSSYGPTADFRRKPNVSAYGHVVASGPDGFNSTQGTSFASPLVAGFAACAKQANPNLTAMQLFREIEKSGSLYPYFDYAHGFGIPQASYFTAANTPKTTISEPTFAIAATDYGAVVTVPMDTLQNDTTQISQLKLEGGNWQMTMPETNAKPDFLYYHIENSKGYLDKYFVLTVEQPEVLRLIRSEIGEGKKVRIHYKGYTAEHQF